MTVLLKHPTGLEWSADTAGMISERCGEPEALRLLRQEAISRLKHTPWPNTSHESWRRTDPRAISLRKFTLWDVFEDQPALDLIPEMSNGSSGIAASRLEMFNLNLLASELDAGDHGRGVRMGPLQEGFLSGVADKLTQALLDAPGDEDSPAVSLAQIGYSQGGGYVFVPAGAEAAKPLLIRHYASTPGAALMPLNLIVLEDESRATVLLDQHALGDQGGWFAGMTRVHLGQGARLNLVVVNRSTPESSFYDYLRVQQGRDSQLHLTWADLTRGWAVLRRETAIMEPGGEATMRGAHVGMGNSHLDLRTRQEHPAPGTKSDLLYKAAMFGHSRSVYQGLINVGKEAVGANAYQLNRNLLMSPGTFADSIPKLEILVDDVRCTHGASTGKVGRDALFYLMSRGLTQREAARMLVEGFLLDAGDRLEAGAIREYWLSSVRNALETALEIEN